MISMILNYSFGVAVAAVYWVDCDTQDQMFGSLDRTEYPAILVRRQLQRNRITLVNIVTEIT